MVRKEYVGTARGAYLAATIAFDAMSFTVTSVVGWPTGTFPFVVTIGRGTTSEEKILCSGRTGDVVTVQQRGYDGTAPVGHGAGDTVEHTIDATLLNAMSAHVDDPQNAAHDERYLARGPRVTGLPYGVVVEAAGTNHIVNPSFEVDTAGWIAFGTPTAIARDVASAVVGSAGMRVDLPAGVGNPGVQLDPAVRPAAAGGQVWTASAFLRASAGTKQFRVQLQALDAAGAVLAQTNFDLSVGTRAARFSQRLTTPANTARMGLLLVKGSADEGAYSMHIDAVQLEQAASPSTYIDGSLGPGYAWTGAAHASTSTRKAGPAVLGNAPRIGVVELAARSAAFGGHADVPYGVVIEEAVTNLVTNPSFEVDVAGWVAINGAVAARDAAAKEIGSWGLRLDIPAGAAFSGVRGDTSEIPVVAGAVYTFSAFLRTNVEGKRVRLAYDWHSASGGAGYLGSADIRPIPGTVSRRHAVTAVAPATATVLRLYIGNDNTDQGAFSAFVDGVQVERSPQASSYVDGSLGPGYAWTGTPHASTSSRSAGAKVLSDKPRLDVAELYVKGVRKTPVGYADLPGGDWKINPRSPDSRVWMPKSEITVEFDAWITGGPRENSVFAEQNDNTSDRLLIHLAYSNGFTYWDYGNISAGGRISLTTPAGIYDAWHHWAFTASRSGGFMKIYMDGAVQQHVGAITPGALTTTYKQLALGQSFIGRMKNLRIWDHARSDAQVLEKAGTTIAESNVVDGLVANWPLDDYVQGGPAVHDISAGRVLIPRR